MKDSSKRIAFVSTWISGTDGVSLEIEKWAAVLERKGIEPSIELVRRLGDPRFKLVISHSAGDEGDVFCTSRGRP